MYIKLTELDQPFDEQNLVLLLYQAFHINDYQLTILDECNSLFQIYNKITDLLVNSDLRLRALVTNFKKFSKIQKMTISGQHWFYLDCTQISVSFKYLDVTDQSNLPYDF